MRGRVEGRFIFSTALSKHLVPFALRNPPPILLPCDSAAGNLRLNGRGMRNRGFREFAKWMATAEGIWNTARKQKSERQTVYEWLDYRGKLTAQSLSSPYLVLYNAAGTNISAAVVDRASLLLPFAVEHKLYWAAFESAAAAHYLTAILNSNVPNSGD